MRHPNGGYGQVSVAPGRRGRGTRRDPDDLGLDQAGGDGEAETTVLVVGPPEDVVVLVGQVEPPGRLIDPGRPDERQGPLPALDPALHVEFAEVADVVGMQMAEEDRPG